MNKAQERWTLTDMTYGRQEKEVGRWSVAQVVNAFRRTRPGTVVDKADDGSPYHDVECTRRMVEFEGPILRLQAIFSNGTAEHATVDHSDKTIRRCLTS